MNWWKLRIRIGKLWPLRILWTLVYWRWLSKGEKVICVVGWRTALVETRWKNRRTITPCFGPFQ